MNKLSWRNGEILTGGGGGGGPKYYEEEYLSPYNFVQYKFQSGRSNTEIRLPH